MVSSFSKSSQAGKETLKLWACISTVVAFHSFITIFCFSFLLGFFPKDREAIKPGTEPEVIIAQYKKQKRIEEERKKKTTNNMDVDAGYTMVLICQLINERRAHLACCTSHEDGTSTQQTVWSHTKRIKHSSRLPKSLHLCLASPTFRLQVRGWRCHYRLWAQLWGVELHVAHPQTGREWYCFLYILSTNTKQTSPQSVRFHVDIWEASTLFREW